MKVLVLLLVISTSVFSVGADQHAPIGVMLDHTHQKGELMFSVRHMKMNMNKLSRHSNEVSTSDYFANSSYMMAPKSMSMDMTMIGAMYGLSDKLTLNLMLGYTSNEMTMIRRMGMTEVDSKSADIADTKLNALYSIFHNSTDRLVLSVGAIIPTGSIDEKDGGLLLGYPMQTGSGSFGLQSYLTYVHYLNELSIGAQFGAKTYLEDNDEDYRVGDFYESSLWLSYSASENFSTSLRLNQSIQDVFDYDTNRQMSSAVDFRSLNGQFTTLGLGINYLNTTNLKGHRFAIEYAKQVDSDFSGYQLQRDETITIGWQKVL